MTLHPENNKNQGSLIVGIIIVITAITTIAAGLTGHLSTKPVKDNLYQIRDDLRKVREDVRSEFRRVQVKTGRSIYGLKNEISVMRTDIKEMRLAIDRILAIMLKENMDTPNPARRR